LVFKSNFIQLALYPQGSRFPDNSVIDIATTSTFHPWIAGGDQIPTTSQGQH
jgi:hypothetical protein